MRVPRKDLFLPADAPTRIGRTRRRARPGEIASAEPLEPRQLLASVFAVTDNNVLLEFDSANPQTILRATPITGLGAGEVMSAIDFRAGTEQLYGIPSGDRTPVYTIDRKTGAATRVGPGVPFNFPISKAAGLDYDELNGYFRYIDEQYGNYRIDPVSGRTLRNDAGQEGLAEIAYRPLAGDPANFGMVGVNHMTDQFMRLDPERMTVLSTGPLGVDAAPFIGLDIAPDGTTYITVRVGGVNRFGTISAIDGHSFVEIGTIGDGLQHAVRNIAVEPVRRAPVLDASLIPTLGAIDEDSFGHGGTRIRDLLQSVADGFITDASPGAAEGIALVAADSSAGFWQYSLNGFTWANLESVSESSALLLPADESARIRLIPSPNFHGQIAQALRFRAWDQTGGLPGQRINIAGPGAWLTDSLSTTTGTASLTVLPVRDAPSIASPLPTGGAFFINDKQTERPFQSVTIDYIDDANRVLTVDVAIDRIAGGGITPESAAGAGFVLVDAAAGRFRFTGTAAAATGALRQLVFSPAQNQGKVGTSSTVVFAISVDDGLGPASQTTSAPITVTSSNDAPTFTRLTINNRIKFGKTVRPFRSVVIADVDPEETVTVSIRLNAPRKATLTAASLRASGFAKVGNGLYRFTGSASAATAASRKLKFAWSTRLNTTVNQQVKLRLTIADAAGATVSNNQTMVKLKR